MMNLLKPLAEFGPRWLAAALPLLLFAPSELPAQSGRGLRCGGDLVTPGYLKYEVLQSCGEIL